MSRLRLRPATRSDARLLWEWRNDPVARANSFHSEVIPWESHLAWLKQKFASLACQIWILEQDGCPVGQIRYDRQGDTAEIAYAVAGPFRGQNLGTQLLQLSRTLACRGLAVDKLIGIVKVGNEPSVRAFLRAGFRCVGTLSHGGEASYQFEWCCRGNEE